MANNPVYQSYTLEMRDYMIGDKNGTPFWTVGGNDYPTTFTPTYAMLHGCVGYTAELPAYSETTCQAAVYGLWGLADYVAAYKESYFANLSEIYSRGIVNKNSDAEVGPWFVDGKTLPAGTAVVSMYQAKRSVANSALYKGNLIKTWDSLTNETGGAFNYIRGFDMVTCVKPAEYDVIAGSLPHSLLRPAIRLLPGSPYLMLLSRQQISRLQGLSTYTGKIGKTS